MVLLGHNSDIRSDQFPAQISQWHRTSFGPTVKGFPQAGSPRPFWLHLFPTCSSATLTPLASSSAPHVSSALVLTAPSVRRVLSPHITASHDPWDSGQCSKAASLTRGLPWPSNLKWLSSLYSLPPDPDGLLLQCLFIWLTATGHVRWHLSDICLC